MSPELTCIGLLAGMAIVVGRWTLRRELAESERRTQLRSERLLEGRDRRIAELERFNDCLRSENSTLQGQNRAQREQLDRLTAGGPYRANAPGYRS